MAGQLTLDERETVSQRIYAGESNSEIAQATGRHRSTIWRERNGDRDGEEYHAVSAQRRADQRCRERPWERKMDRQQVRPYVCEPLERRWSPDQIGGRAQEQFPDEPRRHISQQTIYAWINSRPPDERRRWKARLRRHGRTRPERDGRGRLSGAPSIAGRPKVVNERRRSGDWEGNTIVGAQRSGEFVPLVERRTGELAALKSCDRRARRVRRKIERMHSPWPAELRVDEQPIVLGCPTRISRGSPAINP